MNERVGGMDNNKGILQLVLLGEAEGVFHLSFLVGQLDGECELGQLHHLIPYPDLLKQLCGGRVEENGRTLRERPKKK